MCGLWVCVLTVGCGFVASCAMQRPQEKSDRIAACGCVRWPHRTFKLVSAPMIMYARVLYYAGCSNGVASYDTHARVWAESGYSAQRRTCQLLAARAGPWLSLSVYALCAVSIFAMVCFCVCPGGRERRGQGVSVWRCGRGVDWARGGTGFRLNGVVDVCVWCVAYVVCVLTVGCGFVASCVMQGPRWQPDRVAACGCVQKCCRISKLVSAPIIMDACLMFCVAEAACLSHGNKHRRATV